MRVVIVLTQAMEPTSGGVQMATLRLARMLSLKGHEVKVFSFAHNGHAQHDDVSLVSATEPRGEENSKNIFALNELLSSFDPHVVVNQMPYLHSISDALEAHGRARLIGCLHNTLYSVRNNLDHYSDKVLPSGVAQFARNPLGRAALLALHRRRHARDLRRILRTYDRFVMFAEPNLEELEFFVPNYTRGRLALIPNSIPESAAEMPRKERRILWLARVTAHQKRADLILPIWRRIAPVMPEWTLDVVGDGPMLDELQRSAAAEDLPRVTFHGRQPSRGFFERANVYFMTSDFEGFPLTLIEAQSRGAVPVAFDTYPMVRWLVHHKDNGSLVRRGDVQGMADAIVDLCKSDKKRTQMAQRALEVAAQYTEAAVAPLWDSLIRAVVGAVPPGGDRGRDG